MQSRTPIVGAALVTAATLISAGFLPTKATAAERPSSSQTGTIDFRIGSRETARVAGARIIVIGDDGDVLAQGVSNSNGEWRVSLPLKPDKRFEAVRAMDTVTAIAVAKGYNEAVVFEVPVAADMVQPIILNPIRANQRNEPLAFLGNLHRHDLAVLINAYAQKVGLSRQAPVPGEQGYSPWGPDIKKR